MRINPREAIDRLNKGMRKAKGNGQPIELVDVRGDELYLVRQGDKGLLLPSDSDLAPVLAEYETGKTMPQSLVDWLGEYQREIEWYQASGRQLSAAAVKERNSIPMMIDAKWTQRAPYNSHLVIDGKTCLTGCNATSMALVLYYWYQQGYKRGCTKTPEYKSGNTLIASLSPIGEFDYEHLTPKKPTTAAGKEAVATLMEYCGKSIKSVYGTTVTNANIAVVATALKNSMRMGSAITTIYASAGESAFEEKIYKQIAKHRPVIAAGWNSSGGHTFVIDGYDAGKDLYHINWGWGAYDGWFAMSALNPLEGYTYNSNKKAVIGIQPEYVMGDMDNDGQLTDNDVYSVVDDILNDKNDPKADMNYDGKVTVTDAQIIVEKIGKP